MSRDWKVRPDFEAECLDCGWSAITANAHGLGVQHARKNGHHVRVEVYRVYHYMDEGREGK